MTTFHPIRSAREHLPAFHRASFDDDIKNTFVSVPYMPGSTHSEQELINPPEPRDFSRPDMAHLVVDQLAATLQKKELPPSSQNFVRDALAAEAIKLARTLVEPTPDSNDKVVGTLPIDLALVQAHPLLAEHPDAQKTIEKALEASLADPETMPALGDELAMAYQRALKDGTTIQGAYDDVQRTVDDRIDQKASGIYMAHLQQTPQHDTNTPTLAGHDSLQSTPNEQTQPQAGLHLED